MRTVRYFGPALLGMALAACQSSSFTGSEGKRSADLGTSTGTSGDTGSPNGPGQDGPGGPGSPGGGPGSPGGGSGGPNGNGSDSKNNGSQLGSPSGNGSPGKIGNVDSANSSNGNPVNNLLNGLQQSNAILSAQPDPNDVIFGGSQRFHLGDGVYNQSSCNLDLSQLTTAGAQYYFQFQVTQNGTDVTVTLGEVCGVDYKFSNTMQIVNAQNQAVAQQVLTPNNGDQVQSIALQAPQLPAGSYQVIVTSNNCNPSQEGNDSQGNPICTPSTNGGPTDRDDFIVGKVSINGSKPIQPGQAGAQQATN